jgi:wobble nucleotide-excising tRNase
MKIKRISTIKNHRIFRDFNWPVDLPNFSSFNLIYGWNGSGKTTLSNLFRHLQIKESISPVDGEIKFDIDGTFISGSDISISKLPQVRVFNRDSVTRNVFEIPNHQLPPVYYLGEDSVEKEKRIVILKGRHDQVEKQNKSWANKKTLAETELERLCTSQAKQIKNLLTVSGGGLYNNYDSRQFKQTRRDILVTDIQPIKLNESEYEKHLATKQGIPMEKVKVDVLHFPDLADITKRVQQTLSRTVLSSALPELLDSPDISLWVEQGLTLHTGDHETDTCRFCKQILSKERRTKLESHFDDKFKKFQSEIDLLIEKVVRVKKDISDLSLPNKNVLYPYLRENFVKYANSFSGQSKLTIMYFESLERALTYKKTEPFKNVDLVSFLTGKNGSEEKSGKLEVIFQIIIGASATIGATLGVDAFNKCCDIIKKHNQHTDNFSQEVELARKALERDIVVDALTEYQVKNEAIDYADTRRDKAKGLANKIQSKITELEESIQQHQKPADELNNEMASYLGRDELRFNVEKTGYTITRNGQPAMHLSEGERTAIAFMYFLKSIEDSSFDITKGVIVIDDPVSSLDANSLYSAFGFMKSRTKDANQLFVLTHNFSFFRQVRNWYQKRPHQERKLRPASFYMLTSKNEGGIRAAQIEKLDSLLQDYESEYHYLFKCVLNAAESPVAHEHLEKYYGMPNIARRLLEAFLAFRYPNGSGELYKKLELVPFDSAKKAKILRFLHTHSHFDQIGDPEHDLSVLSETPAILKDILELIRLTDPGHHEGMLTILQPTE